MTAEPLPEAAPLGMHKGIKILGQKIIVNKTGDGLSKSVDVAPTVVETDEERNLSVRIKHRKTRFDNVYTKPDKDSDEPPVLKGVTQVDIFDAVGVVFDDSDETSEAIDDMLAKIAEKRERDATKPGQFKLRTVGSGSEEAGIADQVDGGAS